MATWIVTHAVTPEGMAKPLIGYWYGPDHGWGTTSGSFEDAAEFPTKRAAENALRRVFGRPAVWRRRGYVVARVVEPRCPHDRTRLDWVDDMWQCPRCEDEFDDDTMRPDGPVATRGAADGR